MGAVPPGGLPSPYTPARLVAFGTTTAALTAPVVVPAGQAVIFLWGLCGRTLTVQIERTLDGGATWATHLCLLFDAPGSESSASFHTLTPAESDRAAAAYRFSIPDAPPEGATVCWAVYQ